MTSVKELCPEVRAYRGIGWGCQRRKNHKGKCKSIMRVLGEGDVVIEWVRRTSELKGMKESR